MADTFPQDVYKRQGLIRAHEEGYEAYVLFVIQMKGIRGFTPVSYTHLDVYKRQVWYT